VALLFSGTHCSRTHSEFYIRDQPAWRSTMRQPSSDTRLHEHSRALAGRLGERLETLAVYGALALIAAIVFGTLSTHPF
jgi:hypothetical protein